MNSFMEALTFLLMAGMFVGPAIWIGLRVKNWWWTWFWCAMILLVGVFELVASLTTGHTISQHFWEFSKTNPGEAWMVLAGWTGAWLMLMYHLAVKLLKGKK